MKPRLTTNPLLQGTLNQVFNHAAMLSAGVPERQSAAVNRIINEDVANDLYQPKSACCRAETFLLGTDDHTVVCYCCGDIADQY